MGRLTFFGFYDNSDTTIEDKTDQIKISDVESFDSSKEYLYQEELISKSSKSSGDAAEGCNTDGKVPSKQYALIQFEKPVTCQNTALVIGSKLDTDIHANVCRIAFHGKLLLGMTDPKYVETELPKLKVFKTKVKEGLVERVMDEYTVIGKNMFKKETNIATFTGLKIVLSTGEPGIIEGGFGQSGKIKIRIPGENNS